MRELSFNRDHTMCMNKGNNEKNKEKQQLKEKSWGGGSIENILENSDALLFENCDALFKNS